jgi:L-ascorbate metabolism protein UlaG (beta-lactamase superfamily)
MKARWSCFVFLLALGAGWLAWAQSPPHFTRIQRLTNREMALTVTGAIGNAYRIEAATNLSDWNGFVTFPTNAVLSLMHTDSATPYLDGRFYRAARLTDSNTLSGDHLTTSEGEVIIHPHQHAAVILGWNGKTIHIDPRTNIFSYAGLPRGDLVLVTHEHSDHFTVNGINSVWSNAPIICPQLVYNGLSAAQQATAIVLTNGASTNLIGLKVDAVPASNANHPLGQGNGYVITIGGKRIYFSGDTGTNALYALTNIDVAFVAMNLPFTMDVTNAARAVRVFKPKVVYPYHYSPSTPTSAGDPVRFKQLIGTDLGIEVRLRRWYP